MKTLVCIDVVIENQEFLTAIWVYFEDKEGGKYKVDIFSMISTEESNYQRIIEKIKGKRFSLIHGDTILDLKTFILNC